MKIEIGNLEVLNSGLLIVTDKQNVNFSFEDSLFKKIYIVFTDEDLDSGYEFAKATELKELTITIPKKIQSGLPKYIQIGYHKKRELYFNYNISEIGNSNKLFNYIFLLGAEFKLFNPI